MEQVEKADPLGRRMGDGSPGGSNGVHVKRELLPPSVAGQQRVYGVWARGAAGGGDTGSALSGEIKPSRLFSL